MDLVNQNLVMAMVAYVHGLATSDQLKEWLAANVWELASSTSPLDRMMLGELELALAEYDRGERDDSYLKRHAQALLMLPNPALMPALREPLSYPTPGLALA